MGGWVVEFLLSLWMGDGKVEEEQAVRMSYCGVGMGGWVGGWADLPYHTRGRATLVVCFGERQEGEACGH